MSPTLAACGFSKGDASVGKHTAYTSSHAAGTDTAAGKATVAARAAAASAASKRGGAWVPAAVSVVAVLIFLAIAGAITFAGSKVIALRQQVNSLMADARALMADVSTVEGQVADHDWEAVIDTAEGMKAVALHMQDTLGSDELTWTEALPVYGADITGARELTQILVDGVDDALIPAMQLLISTSPPSVLSGGGVDMDVLNTLLDAYENVEPAVRAAISALDGLPGFHISQIQRAVDFAKEKLDGVPELLDMVDSCIPAVRAILGDGNRTFLLLAQNPAEMRATGGFPGAVGTLRLVDGKVELGEFDGPNEALEVDATEEYGITDVELAVSRTQMRFPRDSGYTPDFTRAAWISALAFEHATGIAVDGVISLTPATVQYVLQVTDPITLSDGTELNGANAAYELQYALYWRYMAASPQIYNSNNGYLDALFVEAAGLAFGQLMDNLDFDSVQELAVLMQGCVARREAMLWLADPDEQAAIAPLKCSGALNEDPGAPELGVFFNGYVASKALWWLDQTTVIGEAVTNADGTITYAVTSTFVNTMTEEEGRVGGRYIMGGGWYYMGDGIEEHTYWEGVFGPIIEFVAPAGGTISDLASDLDFDWVETEYEGHQLIYNTIGHIRPQETLTVTCTVTVAAGSAPLTSVSQPTLTLYRDAA